jgi:hypothetical protein
VKFPRSIAFRSIGVAVAFAFLPSLALAGRYELVKGQGVEVCEAYEKNLNSFKPTVPMVCHRPISPKFGDFQKPTWDRLNFDQNSKLILAVDNLLRPNYFANPEIAESTLRGNVKQDNYKYQLTVVDIDNDGKTEPVLRFVESCWPGSPRLGGAALVVLQQDGKNVDVKKSEMIATEDISRYNHQMRDVFLYKGKTYVDNWLVWSMDTGQLQVSVTENGETKLICTADYLAK